MINGNQETKSKLLTEKTGNQQKRYITDSEDKSQHHVIPNPEIQ